MKIYRLRDRRHQTRMATSDDGKNFFALNGDIYCREFKITTGIFLSTAGNTVAGCSTLAPKYAISAASANEMLFTR